MSWLFVSGGQSIGVSASVLPANIQDWFPLGLTAWISLLFKGFSRVISSTTVWKHQFFGAQPSLWSNSHIRTRPLEKPQPWLCTPLSAKWHFYFLICQVCHSFSSKEQESFNHGCSHHLQWFWNPRKYSLSLYCFHCFPIYLPWSDRTGCHDHFLNGEFSASFLTLLFHFH